MTTDIITLRAKIISKIDEIQAIPKQQYTAMQLHDGYLSRVQRREDTLFHQRMALHTKRLKYDLAVIDNYLATSTKLPTIEGAPLTPPPTSMWVNVPLPVKILTRTSSRPRTMRRIR